MYIFIFVMYIRIYMYMYLYSYCRGYDNTTLRDDSMSTHWRLPGGYLSPTPEKELRHRKKNWITGKTI